MHTNDLVQTAARFAVAGKAMDTEEFVTRLLKVTEFYLADDGNHNAQTTRTPAQIRRQPRRNARNRTDVLDAIVNALDGCHKMLSPDNFSLRLHDFGGLSPCVRYVEEMLASAGPEGIDYTVPFTSPEARVPLPESTQRMHDRFAQYARDEIALKGTARNTYRDDDAADTQEEALQDFLREHPEHGGQRVSLYPDGRMVTAMLEGAWDAFKDWRIRTGRSTFADGLRLIR